MHFCRSHTGRTILAALLLLALAVRGLVPAGFMPAGGGDGGFQLVICTPHGTETITVGPEHMPFPVDEDRSGDTPPECPFTPLNLAATDAPAPVINATRLALRIENATPVEKPYSRPAITLGHPRAPPHSA